MQQRCLISVWAAAAMPLIALVGSSAARAGEKKIELSPSNTKIEWVGTKPAGKHVGGFSKFTGSIEGVAAGLKGSKITLDIDCNSLFSDDAKLTKHLKSPDFFEVLNFPKATFVSTKIEPGTADVKGSLKITGDLTLRGKTKSITFDASVNQASGLTLDSTVVISKKDFGMTYGAGKINDEVTIKVSIGAK